ncbi:MAG: glycoside hydrolase family 3 C-terminal domain-containing protein [Bacilli bacterium]|jgi:beta-glucosidase|nr:glycoside hydrolase family 3 C-terminal domain-containing protein [Bacilli bacterium]
MSKEKDILELSPDKKVHYLRGVGNWYLYPNPEDGKSARMSDGPVGLRFEVTSGGFKNEIKKSVALPSGALLCASWDRDLAKQFGEYLAEEAYSYGADVLLGPAICIKRTPLGGRGFEYFTEDPYLSGTMAASYIQAVEGKGIATSLKHYVANSQETERMCINEVIDERALHEIYLRAFEIAVKEGKPSTIMASYNKINGLHVTESKELLNGVLRKDWSYQGLIESDWGAVNDAVLSVKAGLDVEMPQDNDVNYQKTLDAYQNDPEFASACDKALVRIHALNERHEDPKGREQYNYQVHHVFSRLVGEESVVLLKNEGNILPLRNIDQLLVLGSLAKTPRFQGGGSSHLNAVNVTSFTDQLSVTNYQYLDGYNFDDENDDSKIQEAVDAAKKADKVLLFAGINEKVESEGFDRFSLSLPKNQIHLIERVHEVNPNIVLILMNGGPILMPFIDKVKGVMETYLGGEAISEAVFDLLYGVANPSGHLAETFPLDDSYSLCRKETFGDEFDSFYKESIYVGYRYYSTFHKKTLFPFGYGLSYTSFRYSDFSVDTSGKRAVATFTIENTGKRYGKTVPQIYVSKPSHPVFVPEKELIGYTKVGLEAGEKKTVKVELDERYNTYYNVAEKRFVPLYGDYVFILGQNAEDEGLKAKATRQGVNLPSPYENDSIPDYFASGTKEPDIEEFRKLFVDQEFVTTDKTKESDLDTSIMQAYKKGSKGAGILIKKLSKTAIHDDLMMYNQLIQNPVRTLLYWTPELGKDGVDQLLDVLNDRKLIRSLIGLGIRFYKIYRAKKKQGQI